jgi:UDPglucose 6-dehydrogenase
VIGLGRIGAPLAACLAARGVAVVGADIDRRKVDAINDAVPPVSEPGLGALLRQVSGTLGATHSVADAVLSTDATFVTVPTPAEGDGSLSIRHVQAACVEIGSALRTKPGFHLVAVTSTVMPGTTGGVLTDAIADASGKRAGSDFAICYVPEFVALGTAIRDFLSPDFVLIGEPDPASGELLEGLFLRVCEADPPIARTSPVAAEVAKLAVNAFLATRITFANVLAQISEGLSGCDVDAVTAVVGLDSRIGDRYLTGAVPFGGPCLPRDTAALATLARTVGAFPALADAALQINEAILDRLTALTKTALAPGGCVAVCGLAFKPGTDVFEDAPGAMLARRLAGDGIRVLAFDTMITERARAAVGDAVELTPSLQRCVERADVLVLTTPAEDLADLEASLLDREAPRLTVIDCWRAVESARLRDANHIALGRGPVGSSRDRPRVEEPVRT